VKYLVLTWAFVAGCLACVAVEAGSCHGTKKPKPVVVEQPTPAAPVSHVDVTVDVETATPADVEASVVVNGDDATGGSTGAAAAEGGDSKRRDVRRNANREARATKAAGRAQHKAHKAAKRAGESAKQQAVDEAVSEAYGR